MASSVLPQAAPTAFERDPEVAIGRVGRARALARSNTMLTVGLALIAAVLLFAVLGPLLIDTRGARVGAFPASAPPNGARLLGTDAQGRDVFSVLVLATPETVKIALIAGVVGLGIGVVLGLTSGFAGGVVDAVIRIVADVLMTIPGIAILILIATQVRTMSVELMGLIVAMLAWMYPTRTIRAQVLTLRERGYVQVARLNGVGPLELVLKEILPNLLPYIAAGFVAATSNAILATVGLEALGLGSQNSYTLGMMIYWAQFYGAILRGMWWWWGPPLVLIVLVFVGLLLTSAGLDRVVDKRLRRYD